MPVELCCRVNC